MAFPASNGSIPLTLEGAWALARSAAQTVQQNAISLNAQIASGSVSSQAILGTCGLFATLNVTLSQCAAVPNLAAYAQAQVSNPGLDVAGDFNTMQTALVAVITWISQNFPSSAFLSFSGDGQPVYVNFSQAQLAPLAALLTTLIATID